MDFSAIGQRIRELRKSLRLSQEELAEGICTQAQISKIEKGDVFPYANTLYLISQKLGVDVNYFFEIGSTPRVDYVNEVTRQLRLARRNMRYDEMQRIIKLEEKNPLFMQNGRLWVHKGICEHVVHKNADKAIEILTTAINITHTLDKIWTEREIELLLSMGSVYFVENELNLALDIFLEAKQHLDQLFYLSDNSIMPRLYYNIARVYTRFNDYETSISFCKEAIKYCLDKDNLFPIGELHYHMSYNYEKLGDISTALLYLKKTIMIFDLIEDEKYMKIIRDKQTHLESLYQKQADHSAL